MDGIEADLLIPGRGDPVRDATLLIDQDRIAYAGPAAGAPVTPDATVTRATTVLPGLWDAHTHLLGLHTLDFSQLFSTDAAGRAARCTHSLRAALDAGITSVREVGGLGVHLARVVDEGLIEGPAIYGAGSVISTTGGHGDVHAMPLPWVADYAHQ